MTCASIFAPTDFGSFSLSRLRRDFASELRCRSDPSLYCDSPQCVPTISDPIYRQFRNPRSRGLFRRAWNGRSGIRDLRRSADLTKYRNLEASPLDNQTIAKLRKTAYEDDIREEGLWLKALNKFKIGVKFYGFSWIRGNLGLVIEKVTEKHMVLKEPDEPETMQMFRNLLQMKTEKGFRVTKETIQELDRILDLMIKNEIMAGDLQFLLTESGRLILIDPELFRKYSPDEDYQTPKQFAEDQRQNFKDLLLPFMINYLPNTSGNSRFAK